MAVRPEAGTAGLRLEAPLWRIRLRLWRRSAARSWQIFRESRIGPLGLAIIVAFGLFGLAHPLLMGRVWDPAVYDPVTGYDFMESVHPVPPSLRHPLGTDPVGRDVLSQLMSSTASEFVLGVIAASVTVVIGTVVGTLAAYHGGWVDTFFMRLADLVILFPFLPFLIVLTAFTEIDLPRLAVLFGVLGGFGGITIVLKAQALSVVVRPFVEAARLTGASHFWVIRRHVIPNVMPLSFLYMMFNVTGAVVAEATLSFLGVLDIPVSWGLMIHTADASGYLLDFATYWWLWLPPGTAITLFCAAFYMVGRGLEEVINPRLRRR